MKRKIAAALAALTLFAGLSATFAPSASAQSLYTTWQPQWDHYQYDRHHVILGSVVKFWPYRVVVQRRNGDVETIDLKPGTTIRPEGATPTQGDRIAIFGYYSNGTFIANGVILR